MPNGPGGQGKGEKGTATLRVGNDLWNYLAKVKRLIKLPSSMMSASWMGSHFNNDDLVKESRMAEDYRSEITFTGEREGRDVIELTCLPIRRGNDGGVRAGGWRCGAP
jgi:hypothetical protein